MRVSLFFITIGVMFLGISTVLAHGYVERTDPEDGAELSDSPETIRIWFNEPLIQDSGRISAIHSNTGSVIALGPTIHDTADPTLIYAGVQEELPEGAYIVTAKATVISDGHEPSNSFVFWVGQKNRPTSDNSDELEPAYGILVLFAGLLGAASGISWWMMRQKPLEILHPSQDITHISLE